MKKLMVWITLALILEVGGLYMLNNFVLINSSEFKTKKIEIKKNIKNNINSTIQDDASNINLSYDGKYLTYYKDKQLYIEETETGKVDKISTENNEVIMYYRWLDSRNLIAIVEKVKKDGAEKLQLITYNPTNSSKSFVQEICNYEKNMEVGNMTLSIFTNVYYIDVSKGGSKNVVYRIDRNEKLTKVDIKATLLGNIQVIPHEDRLIYEDKTNGKFFVTSPNKQLIFNSNKKLTLIGIDRNDIIYIGEIDVDKISSIIYGKVNEDMSNWNNIRIDSPVNINNLYLSNESEILINDNLKGSIKNLTTGKEVEYDGKLIQIKEDFIAIKDTDGKLVYKNLKNQ